MAHYFKNNSDFHNVYVKGEVTGSFISRVGHHHFDLKDKHSHVHCIVYRDNRRNIAFEIENGMKLLVIAHVGLYWPQGKYQLDVRSATEDGLGQLFVKFQQLRKKLEKEGLFAREHKKELPRFPKMIGVISSRGGSVIHDIIKTVRQNWPYCQVILFPAAVQGSTSKSELVTQIRRADESNMDVMIIARGGGNMQELWSFNEEMVVRTIFNCRTPVISAIGHEDDVTLSDLVADKRASTPTMAASLAIEDKNNILNNINHYNSRLIAFISSKMGDYRQQLDFMLSKPIFSTQTYVYKSGKNDFDDLCSRFDISSKELINSNRVMLDKITAEYVIKRPCKIQVDNSKSNLNDLKTRLFEAMNKMLNEYMINLDKATNNFKFLSDKLVASKRHELEISRSYLMTNPCKNQIGISKNSLNLLEDKLISQMNGNIKNNKRNLDNFADKFKFLSEKLVTSKKHDFEMAKSNFSIEICQNQIVSSRNSLNLLEDKLISQIDVNVKNNKADLDLLKNNFKNNSNDLISNNSHRLDSIKNLGIIRNPQRLYGPKFEDLSSIKNEKIIKNPYLILDSYKSELKIYKEKLDKINKVIELKKEQEKQKQRYLIVIAAIVIVMIMLFIIFGGIL